MSRDNNENVTEIEQQIFCYILIRCNTVYFGFQYQIYVHEEKQLFNPNTFVTKKVQIENYKAAIRQWWSLAELLILRAISSLAAHMFVMIQYQFFPTRWLFWQPFFNL